MKPDIEFPRMGMVHQTLESHPLEDIVGAVRRELEKAGLSGKIRAGQSVALSAGSRGIRHIDIILKTVVDFLKELKAEPFIVPAMGSHGGATAGAQVALLSHYGITEEAVGAPIRATMDVREIGKTTEGLSVYVDRYACEADAILVINRIKPHTKFKGPLESGLCKMMNIGFGKHQGAKYYHKQAIKFGFPEIIESVSRVFMEKLPVVCGLAIVEDAYEETAVIESIEKDHIVEREKQLLDLAKRFMPRLPFPEIDVLIIDWMGKEISGTGMDYNIIGRNRDIMDRWFSEQKIGRVFVRDLTPASEGNAMGIGMADYTTDRLVNSIDYHAMYTNALTASGPEKAMIPMHFPTDLDAMSACFSTIGPAEPEEVRCIWIRDTLSLENIAVSENLYRLCADKPGLSITAPLTEISFHAEGNLVSPFAPDKSGG